MARLLPAIDVPVLIISGSEDPFVPPANGEYLRDALPFAVSEVVPSGHFVWEDAPDEYAGLVTAWIGRASCRERVLPTV